MGHNKMDILFEACLAIHMSEGRAMQTKLKALTFAGFFLIVVAGVAHAQGAVERLQPLVETSAQRLAIAKQVAFAKWDSGSPVEDTLRETQVIVSASNAGESKGLDKAFVASFFRAQIEANKLVQYSLLSDWRRLGRAPHHLPVSLNDIIRPELDQVQAELLLELEDTAVLRADALCRANIAKAVEEYVFRHAKDISTLESIALDRALAGVCNP